MDSIIEIKHSLANVIEIKLDSIPNVGDLINKDSSGGIGGPWTIEKIIENNGEIMLFCHRIIGEKTPVSYKAIFIATRF